MKRKETMYIRFCPEKMGNHTPRGVWCLGNFDGVHRGHQALLRHAQMLAHDKGVSWGVMTFEPHPRTFFQPSLPPFRLMSCRQKIKVLRDDGVPHGLFMPFTAKLAQQGGEAFVQEIIIRSLKASAIVVGHDFHFGKGREGTPLRLQQWGQQGGLETHILPPLQDAEGHRYASAALREALGRGDVEGAAQGLGRAWRVEGKVVKGQQLGRTWGFPTANIPLKTVMCPLAGVYGVHVWRESDLLSPPWEGIANIGRKPTVGSASPLVEVHLLNHHEDLYGQRLVVEPLWFVRPEQAFPHFEALRARIQEDVALARMRFAQGELRHGILTG